MKSSHQCLDCGRRPQVHICQLHTAYMCLYTATLMLPHTVRQRDTNTAFLSHMGEGLLLSPELDGVGQGAAPLGLCSWTLPPRMAPVLPSHTPLGPNSMQPYSELLLLPFSRESMEDSRASAALWWLASEDQHFSAVVVTHSRS